MTRSQAGRCLCPAAHTLVNAEASPGIPRFPEGAGRGISGSLEDGDPRVSSAEGGDKGGPDRKGVFENAAGDGHGGDLKIHRSCFQRADPLDHQTGQFGQLDASLNDDFPRHLVAFKSGRDDERRKARVLGGGVGVGQLDEIGERRQIPVSHGPLEQCGRALLIDGQKPAPQTFKAEKVAGTLIGRRNRPHLLEAYGQRFDLQLEEHLTVFRYRDLPGMIGRVGTAFGDHEINIVSAAVGRQPDEDRGEAGHSAVMAVTTDVAVPRAVVEEIVAGEGFEAGYTVSL